MIREIPHYVRARARIRNADEELKLARGVVESGPASAMEWLLQGDSQKQSISRHMDRAVDELGLATESTRRLVGRGGVTGWKSNRLSIRAFDSAVRAPVHAQLIGGNGDRRVVVMATLDSTRAAVHDAGQAVSNALRGKTVRAAVGAGAMAALGGVIASKLHSDD